MPGVNNLGTFGRWAFAEFTKVFEIEAEFGKLMDKFRGPARDRGLEDGADGV